MNFFAKLLAVLACTAFALVACSSAPVKKTDSAAPATPAVATPVAETPQVYKGNLDTAHAAFIAAMDMELRGLGFEADSLWILAWQYDPNNRFLAFQVAQRMLAHGADSLAFAIAKQANKLKGRQTAAQLETMARLYVKEGVADSARKYFVAALDSSKNQDMKLLYDYSLFLEAVQDKEELVRVYEQLLPQTNYIQSLFNRQVKLLTEQGKDSAVVELFMSAYEATGNRDFLAKGVHALVLQKRFIEARAVADTITGSTESDAMIVELALLTFVDGSREPVLKFLKKKYYNDGVRVPELVYHLGLNEYMLHEVDSAKVHLDSVHLKLERDPSYGAQACRTLSAIAFSRGQNKEGVRYAEQADSLLQGEGKVFLALALGTAKEFNKAYALLDSMLGVWSNWRPMEGVVDSAQLNKLMTAAKVKHRRFQRAYADVLMLQARDLEGKTVFTDFFKNLSPLAGKPKESLKDSLNRAAAREARTKAELFWESILAEEPDDVALRFTMARNLERLGRIDEMFVMFEAILKSPQLQKLDYPEVANYYGYTLINLNRNKAEVEYGYSLVLKALDAIKGDKPDAIIDSKAWGLYRLGRFQEALEVILQVNPEKFKDDDEYLEHLAAIQDAAGKKTEAAETYRRLLKLRPKHPAALEFLKGKK
ncbi:MULTISPECIES: tetratricopeptide repeat protein [unclassified Fibrobacter]|uniref:tetratricopeptide repeat protein n=1 Tax=unclassified Fibrobacter TaxID=2634177 RepID=UPI0025BE0C7C|nr:MULTISPECIES: tetratricopeptide repeat protein [unclassified Fibrobacter]